MSIHHATVKKAAKLNVTLVEDNGTYIATLEDGETTTASFPDAKLALEDAIRIQNLIDAGEYDPEAEAERVTSSIVKPKYRDLYKKNGDPDSCGDNMSSEFKNFVTTKDAKGKDVLDMDSLRMVAKDNELAGKLNEWMTKGLNNGQCRMNLGNMLRKKFRDGSKVYFGKFVMTPEFDDDGNLI